MVFNLVDYDIYSKRITFFFDKKEKIGSFFGLFLTIIYILFSILIFIYYIIYTLQRVKMNVYYSTVYSKDPPVLEVNPKLLYFAFGLEDPKTSNRFIDQTIYFPKILFFDKIKVNGEFINVETRELEYEVCKKENFGEEYKHFFLEDVLNNSYCLKDYNLTLAGGHKYNRMSYFTINLYPCLNTSENHNHCKPKEVIDKYIKGGNFSILSKDIGLNPTNFSHPVLPTFQSLYSTIDESIFRNFILYYGITEIQTDVGLFFERINSKKYLEFRKEDKSFYFRDESEYYSGKSMISISFKLDDLIKVEKRNYSKIPEAFSKVGGHMQLLYTLFTFLSYLFNELIPELKIINGIFKFNIKQKKMTIKIHSIKDFNRISFSKTSSDCIYFPLDKYKTPINKNINDNNISKNSLIGNDNGDNNSSVINIINNKKPNFFQDKKENPKKDIINNGKVTFSVEKKNNNNINNQKKESNNMNKNKNYIYRVGSFYPKKLNSMEEKSENESENGSEKSINILKEYIDKINFNIFDYYCFRKISRKKKQIELFNSGLSLFKKRMDIINVFTLLLLTEKNCLKIEH